MDLEFKKLKKMIKLMRNEGVLHLKQGETELTLSPSSLFPKIPNPQEQNDSIQTDEQYTDDDLINWSSITAGIGMDN